METRSASGAANGEARGEGAGGGEANGQRGRGGAAMAEAMAMAAGGPRRCRRLEGEEARAALANADTLLFDCDGVLWRGEAAVSGAAAALGRLAAAGKRLCYVTNNSGRTRAAYTEKLRRLGFPAAEPRHVFSSAFCAARYLRQALPPGAAAYVLGSPALAAELEAAGVPHLGPGPAALPGPAPAHWVQAPLDPAVRAVLVGFDEHFSYAKLCQALRYLLRGGPECLLVGTNRDHRLPLEGGAAIPGARDGPGGMRGRAPGLRGLRAQRSGSSHLRVVVIKHERFHLKRRKSCFPWAVAEPWNGCSGRSRSLRLWRCSKLAYTRSCVT